MNNLFCITISERLAKGLTEMNLCETQSFNPLYKSDCLALSEFTDLKRWLREELKNGYNVDCADTVVNRQPDLRRRTEAAREEMAQETTDHGTARGQGSSVSGGPGLDERDQEDGYIGGTVPVKNINPADYEKFAYHGGPWDRGAADSWYRRPRSPHKYPDGTYNGDRVTDLTIAEEAAYYAGYDWNEAEGGHKEWD